MSNCLASNRAPPLSVGLKIGRRSNKQASFKTLDTIAEAAGK